MVWNHRLGPKQGMKRPGFTTQEDGIGNNTFEMCIF